MSEDNLDGNYAAMSALRDNAHDLVGHLKVDDLLQAIIGRAAALAGTQHGFIYLLGTGESEMEMRLGIGAYADLIGSRAFPGTGVVGVVWHTGQPLVVDDYSNWAGGLNDPNRAAMQAVVGMPLKSRDQIIGVLGLAHPEEGRRFGPAELDALNRFATTASLALDNAKLFQQTQDELTWQEALYRASEMIAKATTLEEIVRGAAELMPQLDLNACTIDVITELDPAGAPIRANLYTVTFTNGGYAFLPNAIGKSISGWLPSDPAYYSEFRATVFPDLLDPSNAVPQDNLKSPDAVAFMLRLGLRGVAVFGLGVHGRKLGYLSYGSRNPLTRTPEVYIERLKNIVDLVATTVDNLQSLQRTEDELTWQEALYRASEMIGKATTLEEIARGAAELMPQLDLYACTIDVITELDPAGAPIRANLYTVTFNNGEYAFLPNAIDKSVSGWLPSDPAYYSEFRATVFPDLLDPSSTVPQDNLKPPQAVAFMLRQGLRGAVALGLGAHGRKVGYMILSSIGPLTRPPQEYIERLRNIIDLVSTAVDNVQLSQQTQDALTWQQVLSRASGMIGKATTVEGISRGAAELVPSLGMYSCTLTLIAEVDPQGVPLRGDLYSVKFRNNEFIPMPPLMGQPIPGWMPSDPAYYRELRITVFPDLQDLSTTYPPTYQRHVGAVALWLDAGLRGTVALALGAHGLKLGYLTFASKRPLPHPPQEYVLRLGNIVDLVSTAANNLQLAQQTQKELAERRRAERFLDSVVENLPITLFAKEAQERRYVRWNKAGEELLGLTREEMLGRNDYDFFAARDQEVLTDKKLVDIPEDRIQTPDKKLRIMHTRKLPILDEAGNPQYLLGIAEDITERKQVEEALVKRTNELEQAYQKLQEDQERLLIAEKMASLGRLTAGIAHEMNTPLAAVRASLVELNRLVKEYESSIGDTEITPDDHREIVQEMKQALRLADSGAERTAIFMRGVKTQTRDLAPHERQKFNAVPVIQEALLLLSYALRKASCTLTFEPAVDYVEFKGSPGRLAQIITNLVTNSIDASIPKGGGPIILQLTPNDHHVTLEVCDSGCGISPEVLTRIFDPMFTTKPFGQGSGLGLTIVHDIAVGDFGGRIEVMSEPGRGTTFRLEFPTSEEIL